MERILDKIIKMPKLGYPVYPEKLFIDEFGINPKDLHDDLRTYGVSFNNKPGKSDVLVACDDGSTDVELTIEEIISQLEDYMNPPVGAWDNIYVSYVLDNNEHKFYIFSLSSHDIETIKLMSPLYKALIKSKVKDFDILS